MSYNARNRQETGGTTDSSSDDYTTMTTEIDVPEPVLEKARAEAGKETDVGDVLADWLVIDFDPQNAP